MKRKLTLELYIADVEEKKRLVVLSGMKGTGKTYAVLEHVKKNYEEYLYIDAGHDENFADYCQISDILEKKDFFEQYFKINEEYLVNIPIILDEPEEELLVKLFPFTYTGLLKIFVILSGFGVAKRLLDRAGENAALLRAFPFDFGEFLVGLDKEWYDEVITGHLQSRRKLPDMIHSELLDLFDLYNETGGMPEIIAEYREMGSLENVRERQDTLRNALWFYLSENKTGLSGIKIRGLLDAVETVLEKKNHKFMFSAIRDGVSRKMYEGELDFLMDMGVLIKLDRISTQETVREDFRLYYSDISLYERRDEQKISESIVIQNVLKSGLNMGYWESGKGAELDLVIKGKEGLIPVDLHLNGKGNGRSIVSFLNAVGGRNHIRLSEENGRFDENQTVLPVYTAYALDRVMK